MELYEKELWQNRSYTNLFNKEIYEYDIQSAGLALSIKYKLLPKSVCDNLLNLPKEERVIQMGLMEKDNKDFTRKLKEAFVEIRRLFFESNGLEGEDIVAIKKDAIFTLRKCAFTEFDNVIFRVKNEYTSYMKFSKLEFYYNHRKMDIKGMNPAELKFHEEYMLDLIRTFIRIKENETGAKAASVVRGWIDNYKWLRMDPEYYRELRPGGKYRLRNTGDTTDYPVFPKERLSELDITYNYLKILTNLALIAA